MIFFEMPGTIISWIMTIPLLIFIGYIVLGCMNALFNGLGEIINTK